ncbi:hypothetical protein GJ744_005499 [Endocarpon pusillum]|uniref:RING-type domain-containing protein n=1 Tax=Endocarpon pusillum TaxID=364733 RepID=A0A8H7A4M2_9EURO|nr:hypothetical protein GJ744_005499 [Endocarpon pusillum]
MEMPTADPRDLRIGTGPGIRGETCDICMEAMRDDHASISHVACQNTFHKTCFDAWVGCNFSQSVPATCPKCRATLSSPAPFPLPDRLAESPFYAVAPWPIYPPEVRSFSERGLATTESEMYDYFVGAGFPTTAFLDRVGRDNERASVWIADYFIRLSRAQNLNDNEAFAHVARVGDNARNSQFTEEEVDTFLEEVGPGEVATDCEIIDSMGTRRPRPSVVRFFDNNPGPAYRWLTSNMAHTQRELGLDIGQMNVVKSAFLASVRQALQARQQNA